MPTNKPPDEDYIRALMLAEVIKRILEIKAGVSFSKPAQIRKKNVPEFMGRMRIAIPQEFETTAFVSTLSYYRNEKEVNKIAPVGTVIFYIADTFLVPLFSKMGYPLEEEDSMETMLDASGTFCNLVGGNFKSGLNQLGYKDLVMSPFATFYDNIVDGVAYNPHYPYVYEIIFFIKGEPLLAADLNMGPIPKEKP